MRFSFGAMPAAQNSQAEAGDTVGKAGTLSSEKDSEFQANLRKTFIDNLPTTLYTLRYGLQELVKADNEMARLKQVYELYRRVHAVNGNAGLAGGRSAVAGID